jgi:sugar phosphate isomerase/epimerase
MGTDRIGVVLDPANLIEGRPLDQVEVAIDEGISLLGTATILGHGKDRTADGSVRAPGAGIVPWDRFLRGLHDAGFDGPLILHGFPESDAPAAASYLRGVLSDIGAA